MNLATILVIYSLSMGSPGLAWSTPVVCALSAQEAQGQESSTQQGQPGNTPAQPQSPASQSQSTKPTQPAPSSTGEAAAPSTQAKPSPHRARRRKKKDSPCSDSPTASNQSAAPSNPCTPPKKVVRNGGSEEPSIQLVGGTTADHASQQRSTEQLTTATEENLKKIAGRQLTASQQEMVNQVKQFMDQSKTAVVAGNLERGHNLAQKAHLLSEELVKP